MTKLSQYYAGCEPIAVIGMVCRFPSTPDCNAYWSNLTQGQECCRKASRQELLAAGIEETTLQAPNFVNVTAPLDGAELFDAALFGYSRQEAESLDPQQRIFLRSVWHVLEDAGYAPRHLPHKTALFASGRMSTYPSRQRIRPAEIARARGMQALLGNDKDYLATRVAYKLNLTGPAMTVQTACSSSLVAVHLACESLRSGECAMAVAGGVAISFPQHTGYLYQPGMIFSPDGHCRPFDASANGTFAGNGVGVVAMRRLDDALADGDPVLAVIRGSAVNNDGHQKVGFTAPSMIGQRDVIAEAMTMADVSSDDIGMIEAHGTATALGDPIEVEALRAAFAGRTSGSGRCAIGSVKGNIGHLDTAAGIASLIKAILAVRHGTIPPTLHFQTANPLLQLEGSPFYVPTRAEPWTQPLRTAGVSSFGIGGTNCHVIVQALPKSFHSASGIAVSDSVSKVLLLSAGSDKSLRNLANSYATAWDVTKAQDLAHTALHGRELGLPHRLSISISEETPAALAAFAGGANDPLLHHGCTESRRKTAWLFTGLGSQWPGMGKTLFHDSPAFARSLEECELACEGKLEKPLREVMFGGHTALLDRIDHAVPAIVAYELAMASHWTAFGLRPDVVVGHSLGEYAAAAVAGCYSFDQVLDMAITSSRCLQSCGPGAMLAVIGEESLVTDLAAVHGVELAAANSDRYLVFSGVTENIEQFAKALRERRIRARRLPTSGAAHSHLVAPYLGPLREHSQQIQASEPHTLMISSLDGASVSADALNHTDFWCRHLRNPVQYREAIKKVLAEGVNIALEVGPDASLTDIGERDPESGISWIPVARRMQAESSMLDQAAMRLYAAGLDLAWKELLHVPGQRIHAPLYAFDEQRYWQDEDYVETAALSPSKSDPGMLIGRQTAIAAASMLNMQQLRRFSETTATLHNIYVDALVQKCVGKKIEDGVTAAEIIRSGRLLPRYRQLLVRLLNACVSDGYYTRIEGRYKRARAVPHEALAETLEKLRQNSEGLDVIPEVVTRAGQNLHVMLSGQVDPVAILFPSGESGDVEVLYRDFSSARYFNQIAAGVLSGLMQDSAKSPRKILEVGGGTGATTEVLLREFVNYPGLEYHFTDISPLFTRRAEEKFKEYKFLRYLECDLQKELPPQGFARESYDLIVAANVIHATQHVGQTLESLRALLKPGGRLLMREITRPVRLFDFVFGPLVSPLQDEDARNGELFLSKELWEKHCKQAGFEKLEWLPDDSLETANLGEHILLATVASRAIPASRPLWITDSGRVLGQFVAASDTYVADWSDCASNTDLLAERIREACSELKRRHGSDGIQFRTRLVGDTPHTLSDVRLRWIGGIFGKARIDIAAREANDRWSTFAVGEPIGAAVSNPLPTSQATPETLYGWNWRAIERSHTSLMAVSLIEATEERIAGIEEAGIEISNDASRRLLVLPDATPLVIVQQIFDALADKARRPLVVVTRGAWALSLNEKVLPSHTAVWAMLRVVASEDPGLVISLVDLENDTNFSDLGLALSAIEKGKHRLAVRGNVIYNQTLTPVHEEASPLPPGSFSGRGWHVITGGFGGLGRVSALWLAQQGAQRIAVLAPRTPPDRTSFSNQLQREFGCELRWLPCDTGNSEQLRESLETLHLDEGVNGVIHAAGILDDAPYAAFDANRLQPVFSIKAGAAEFLQKWLDSHGSRYLLLYSSAAAALGSPGQCAHAFSCGYLDGLAHRNISTEQSLHHLTTISIAWGAWGEVGQAASAKMKERLALSGMSTLSTAEGLWHLEQAVMRGAPYRLAMKVDEKLVQIYQREAGNDIVRASRASEAAGRTPNIEQPILRTDDGIRSWLFVQIAEQLRLDDPAQLTPDQDLLQLGLDSLLFLELSSAIQAAFGTRIDAERAYKCMTIAGITSLVMETVPDPALVQARPLAAHDEANRFEPFPLTPIQHAYWLGRTDLLEYGGVACHVLFEWDLTQDRFDLHRLECAWNALIARHDMLRMVIGDDGLQHVLQQVPEYRFAQFDLRSLSPAAETRELGTTRHELCYKVPPANRWPMCEVAVSLLSGGRYRLHMNLDLLQFDTQSFKIMMDDLEASYSGVTLKPLEFTFRDYVQTEIAERESKRWRESWIYWQELLPDFPPAPVLPLAQEPLKGQPRFTTHQDRLEADEWTRLKLEWKQWGVTPSSALLCLFAVVLARWSRHPSFTLNLTFFSRKLYHPDVQEIIGDFTSVLLVDFDIAQGKSLKEQIESAQARVWKHLAHSEVNGVELLRELRRKNGFSSMPGTPVVFTSMLGIALDGKAIDQALGSFFGDPVFMFTQTPQVWLDHQVMEIENELLFNWFSMDGVLQDGIAASMFADYSRLLHEVAAHPTLMHEKTYWPTGEFPLASSPSENSVLMMADGREANLRHIEGWLQNHPSVRFAQIERTTGEDTDVLVASVISREVEPLPGIDSQTSINEATLPILSKEDSVEVEVNWRYLEERAFHGICHTLIRHGIFTQQNRVWDVEEIAISLGASPQYRRLLEQWLTMLCEKGWVRQEGGRFECLRPFTEVSESAPASLTSPWCRQLLQYLAVSNAHHDSMFQGKLSPLQLLFDADNQFINALYSDNPVMQCLNSAAAEIATQLAHNSNHFYVLEVGGGTAATTRHLLPAFTGHRASYHFTDISNLFLEDARTEFAAYPQLHCSLFDINAPVDFASHPSQGYDLIVAANVLHDASHVVHALRRLGRLLSPKGHLMIIEATERDSVFQLATVGFIEGLSGFEDFRIADNKPMLDLAMWHEVLHRASFETDLVWPPNAAPSTKQHLILAHSKTLARLNLGDIEDHLRRRFPFLQCPIVIQQCEVLPDRGAVRPKAFPTKALRTGIPVLDITNREIQPGLEEAVIAVWQSLLPRQQISRNSDFFQSGGDSLIATRMVAALARRGFPNVSLQKLFENPVLSDFCQTLEANAAPADETLVLLSRGKKKNTIYLFHASDGEVGSYVHFSKHLDCHVYGLRAERNYRAETLRNLAQRYTNVLRERHPAHEPYVIAGWSYGSFLAVEAAHQLRQSGEEVQLILLDPVCKADFGYADRSELLQLLADGRIKLSLPDGFGKLPYSDQLSTFMNEAVSAGLIAGDMDRKHIHEWLDRIDYLFSLLATYSATEVQPIPCLWVRASRRPAQWRPAEECWTRWASFAEQKIVDADHWQMIMSDSHAKQTATLLNNWLLQFPAKESDE